VEHADAPLPRTAAVVPAAAAARSIPSSNRPVPVSSVVALTRTLRSDPAGSVPHQSGRSIRAAPLAQRRDRLLGPRDHAGLGALDQHGHLDGPPGSGRSSSIAAGTHCACSARCTAW
jgi:hypothetical protein